MIIYVKKFEIHQRTAEDTAWGTKLNQAFVSQKHCHENILTRVHAKPISHTRLLNHLGKY